MKAKAFVLRCLALTAGRLNIGACSLGGAQRCLDEAVNYTKERKQFGKSIADFQNTQFMLADMATDLEAARALLYMAAVKVTDGAPDKTKFAAMAKRLATDNGSKIVDQALQLHGGYGYLQDYPIERFWRDLRVHSILEGTNQVMRMIVSARNAAAIGNNMTDDLIIRKNGRVGHISLNRPKVIHSLNLDMCLAMTEALLEWRDDDSVEAIIIDHSEGRGFCAGGDIAMLRESGLKDGKEGREFFYKEYQLNHLLFEYEKPVVAFMDGITMGGGVGISQPAKYRVATENTRFAMPETGIGLFPDVGGGWYLSRLGRTFGAVSGSNRCAAGWFGMQGSWPCYSLSGKCFSGRSERADCRESRTGLKAYWVNWLHHVLMLASLPISTRLTAFLHRIDMRTFWLRSKQMIATGRQRNAIRWAPKPADLQGGLAATQGRRGDGDLRR